MTRAAQAKCTANGFRTLESTEDICPHWDPAVGSCVADHVHAVLCAADRDIDAVRGAEKSNVLPPVAAYHGQHDDLGLLALKIVDGRQANGINQLRPPRGWPVSDREPLYFSGFLVLIARVDLDLFAQGRLQLP